MSEENAERLVRLISGAVTELRNHIPAYHSHLGTAERILFEILPQPIGHIVGHSGVAPFLRSQPFTEFVEFAIADENLHRTLLGLYFDLKRPDDKLLFRRIIQMYILRGLLAVHYHSPDLKPEKILAFADFLKPVEVERQVTVPLEHITLEQDRYDLDQFGTLRIPSSTEVKSNDGTLRRANICLLNFKVTTKKYFGAALYPLAEEIRARVAALRMAVNPFVSFNHFSVSHVHPWEDPLEDSKFYERFHGVGMKEVISVLDDVKAPDASLEEAKKVFLACRQEKWNQPSSWRLALDRLDDAIFKIESRSQDALLDVVIGLESVLVEAESAQESTHKVAVRAARLLGEDSANRQHMFKSVKKLYGLRSKIAHGKSSEIDAATKELLSQGIRILTRILKKMVDDDTTALDLTSVDLL